MRRVVLAALSIVVTVFPSAKAFSVEPTQKPVIVQNADEQGRHPYSDQAAYSSSYCSPNACFIPFKPVPAGYRLVVNYVGVEAAFASSVNPIFARLHVDSSFGPYIVLPAPIRTSGGSGVGTYVSAGPVTFFVEAGHVPLLFLTGDLANSGESTEVSITGYLVAIP